MVQKSDILKALESTKKILAEVPEPEKSLSFPVILAKLLQDVPSVVGEEKNIKIPKTNKEGEKEIFSGLTGGIRLLLSEGFFKIEKTQGEIFAELKRQGYHYPATSLPMILLRSFIQKRVITRYPGNDGKWRYIERK